MTSPPAEEPPVLPQRTDDEYDEGWGDRPGAPDGDDERYHRERPPHHEG